MNWSKPYLSAGLIALAAACVFLAGGCKPSASESSRAGGTAHDHAHGPGDGHVHAQEKNQAAPPGPATSAIRPTLDAGWCAGHGVPEAVCTRCDASLIAQFQKAGDWCGEHELPESQCTRCHPAVAAAWAAWRVQATGGSADSGTSGVRVDSQSGSLRAPGDPLCSVESNIIRFSGPDIVEKAGIATEPVQPRRISTVVDCPAEVRFDNTRFAHITPRAEGIIAEVHQELGNNVAAGAVLATIDSPTMGEAKAAYISAEQYHAIAAADLQRHNAIHDGLERMLQECCAGNVASDELRRKYAEVRLGEYKSRLLNAHAQLELARERFERKRGLADQGISSQDELQLARRDHDQAQADFDATHEAIEIEMEAEHVALDRALRVADITRDAARHRLQVLGVDDGEITALAAGDSTMLSRYTLRSPIAGRIVAREAVVGESTDISDAAFTVADTSRVWLMLNLQERDLAWVKPGDRVLFTIDGLPGHSLEGAIDWISSEVEEPSRTIRARVPLENPNGLLRVNMFGQARVIINDADEVLAVVESAVQSDGCCTLVFVREGDTVFRPRRVVLGAAARGFVEVRDGLAAGEAVVTTGSFLLKTEVLKSSIGAGCCEVEPGR